MIMDRDTIVVKIKKLLKADQFIALRDMVDSITGESSLVNDLSMDSIQILELIVMLEKEFGFSCEPDELNLDMFDRFDSLINFIEEKLNYTHSF
jgi:acyl carrier protein